jgi:hypothetical protein
MGLHQIILFLQEDSRVSWDVMEFFKKAQALMEDDMMEVTQFATAAFSLRKQHPDYDG